MELQNKSRYSSIAFYMPEGMKQKFLYECSREGLDAARVQCFSTDPSIQEYPRILVERAAEYAPTILKVLKMFKTQKSIKIEIATDK